MIRNFLFDVGNVLVHCDMKFGSQEIAKRSRCSADEIELELSEHSLINEFDEGLHTPEEFNTKMREFAGWGGTAQELEFIWQQMLSPNREMLSYMQSLMERGYRAYILSNSNPYHTDYLRHAFSPIIATHGQIFSNECSLVKPDEAIFLHTRDTFGIIPQETLFIDDRSVNVHAAERIGFIGLVHISYESTKRKTEELLRY